MQFGVCASGAIAAEAARAGFDFVEASVGALLKPREPESAFGEALAALRDASPLPCPVANCLVPGDLKITGPGVDIPALSDYLCTVCARAQTAGIDTLVFGSGKARAIPEGFDPVEAHVQIVHFCRIAGDIAEDHGVTLVVEPLNRGDCNVLTRVDECASLVLEVQHPAVRLLADAYHMLRDGDPFASVAEHAGLLRHVHVATVPNRLAPGVEPCDLAPFFAALQQGGYAGRVSIESKLPDPARDLATALSAMRAWTGN